MISRFKIGSHRAHKPLQAPRQHVPAKAIIHCFSSTAGCFFSHPRLVQESFNLRSPLMSAADEVLSRKQQQQQLGEDSGVARFGAAVVLESDTAARGRRCSNSTCLAVEGVSAAAFKRCGSCRQCFYCSAHCQVSVGCTPVTDCMQHTVVWHLKALERGVCQTTDSAVGVQAVCFSAVWCIMQRHGEGMRASWLSMQYSGFAIHASDRSHHIAVLATLLSITFT
jgi:hypothetical protein